MSETKTLQEKFAAATEVTSLGSTDRLAVVDDTGNIKKISNARVNGYASYKTPSSIDSVGTWVRIMNLGTCVGILCITNTFSTNCPSNVVMAINIGYPKSTYLNTLLLNNFFPSSRYVKARFVVSNTSGEGYLEFFVKNVAPGDTFHVYWFGSGVALMQGFTKGEVPEGFSVKEFDLTTAMWGGNSLLFNYLRNLTERRVA